jgi:hypothetical protein
LFAGNQPAILDRQGILDERSGISRSNGRGENGGQCLSGFCFFGSQVTASLARLRTG